MKDVKPIFGLVLALQGCAFDAHGPTTDGPALQMAQDSGPVGPSPQEPPTGPTCRPVLNPTTLEVIEWQCAGYVPPLPDPENREQIVDFELTGPLESGPESSAK